MGQIGSQRRAEASELERTLSHKEEEIGRLKQELTNLRNKHLTSRLDQEQATDQLRNKTKMTSEQLETSLGELKKNEAKLEKNKADKAALQEQLNDEQRRASEFRDSLQVYRQEVKVITELLKNSLNERDIEERAKDYTSREGQRVTDSQAMSGGKKQITTPAKHRCTEVPGQTKERDADNEVQTEMTATEQKEIQILKEVVSNALE